MSTYQATTPPDGTTCDTRGCGSAAEVRVIVAKLRFEADGADHGRDPDTWDSCDLHWPRFRDATMRNGHEVVDTTGDLRRLVADFAGWTVFKSDSGRLYAASYGMTLYGWLVGPLRAEMEHAMARRDRMNVQLCHDGGEIPLGLLHDQLAKRGLKSELDTRAVVPRLRVFSYGEPHDAVAEFQNSVVVSCFGQDRWFAWPWAEPIARVNEVAKAADEILDVLGPGGR